MLIGVYSGRVFAHLYSCFFPRHAYNLYTYCKLSKGIEMCNRYYQVINVVSGKYYSFHSALIKCYIHIAKLLLPLTIERIYMTLH